MTCLESGDYVVRSMAWHWSLWPIVLVLALCGCDRNRSDAETLAVSVQCPQKGSEAEDVMASLVRRGFDLMEKDRDNAHEQKLLRQMVIGDFQPPIYRNSEVARLFLYGHTDLVEGLPVAVSVLSSAGEEEVLRARLVVHAGENVCALDISGLQSGRYRVKVTAQDKGVGGEIRRLLRIENGDLSKPLVPCPDVTGRRLFLIDGHHVLVRKNVKAEVNPGHAHFVSWLNVPHETNYWAPRLLPLQKTAEQKLFVRFQDAVGDELHWRYAITEDLHNLHDWKVYDGVPQFKVEEPLRALFPPEATPRWRQKVSDEQATFRFYNQERDGVPPLNEILVKYTSTQKKDFGGLPIPFRSTYAVWEKTPGQILFLSKEPLCVDRSLNASDAFEEDTDTNDNFGGQHLSPDGRTLYYVVARVVKRFPPFTVPYDNLPNSARMLTVFHTRDGFKWDKQFILPPDENTPWWLQQYGIRIMHDPDAEIYWGYLLTYDCLRQQIFIDVAYSRDFLNWTRPGGKPLLSVAETPGDWLFGRVMGLTQPLYESDGRSFHSMPAVMPAPHFYEKGSMDAAEIKKRYGHRHIEKWPFFDQVGGYDGLAEAMPRAWSRRAVGIFVSRTDGAVALTAHDETGHLVTRLVEAGAGLRLNAKTEERGWVIVELLDDKDRPVPGYAQKFSGDMIDAPIFETLPAQPFKVRLKLKRAQVFALRFT